MNGSVFRSRRSSRNELEGGPEYAIISQSDQQTNHDRCLYTWAIITKLRIFFYHDFLWMYILFCRRCNDQSEWTGGGGRRHFQQQQEVEHSSSHPATSSSHLTSPSSSHHHENSTSLLKYPSNNKTNYTSHHLQSTSELPFSRLTCQADRAPPPPPPTLQAPSPERQVV